MFKLLERRPFLAGFITGFITVGVVSKKLKKLIKGKITIINIELQENKDEDTSPEVKTTTDTNLEN